MLNRNVTGIITVFALSRPEISCLAHRSFPSQSEDNNQVSFVQHFAHGLPVTETLSLMTSNLFICSMVRLIAGDISIEAKV